MASRFERFDIAEVPLLKATLADLRDAHSTSSLRREGYCLKDSNRTTLPVIELLRTNPRFAAPCARAPRIPIPRKNVHSSRENCSRLEHLSALLAPPPTRTRPVAQGLLKALSDQSNPSRHCSRVPRTISILARRLGAFHVCCTAAGVGVAQY